MPTAIAKHPGGRPTKYNDELLRKGWEYLENYESYGHKIPTLAGLSLAVDIDKETATRWGKDKNKSKFSKLVNHIKALQESKLIDNGLDGTFNASITKLCLSKHGYHDNPQQNQANSGIQVTVNRGSVVLKAGGDTLEISDNPGRTLEHGEE